MGCGASAALRKKEHLATFQKDVKDIADDATAVPDDESCAAAAEAQFGGFDLSTLIDTSKDYTGQELEPKADSEAGDASLNVPDCIEEKAAEDKEADAKEASEEKPAAEEKPEAPEEKKEETPAEDKKEEAKDEELKEEPVEAPVESTDSIVKPSLEKVTNSFVVLEECQKLAALEALLNKAEHEKAVIFCSSDARAGLLQAKVEEMGFSTYVAESEAAMSDSMTEVFSTGVSRVLIAASRFMDGVDKENINLTIHFDPAQKADDYLYRSGQKVGFEHRSLAVSLLKQSQRSYVAYHRIARDLSVEMQAFSKAE